MKPTSAFTQLRRLGRFLAVGGLCTLLACAVLYLGIHLLHWHYLLVNALAFFITNYVGYQLNRRYTFEVNHLQIGTRLPRYYLVMALSLGANLFAMSILVEKFRLDPIVSGLAISVVFAGLNYFGHAFWTFVARA